MGIRKFGSGEVTEAQATDRSIKKEAAREWTDQDAQELAQENAPDSEGEQGA